MKRDLYFSKPLMNAAGSLGFAPDTRTEVAWDSFGAFVVNTGPELAIVEQAGPNNGVRDGLTFVLDGNTGMLRLIEASLAEYKELASAQVLSGGDVWAPMALAEGRLVLRDMTKMVCIEVGGPPTQAAR